MELYDLCDREFKMTIIKRHTKFNKTMHEQNKNFNKKV